MWHTETIGEYEVCVKYYSEGSQYGINGGKVSKLEIRQLGQIVANYDRGWDVAPKHTGVAWVLDRVVAKYN